MTGIGPFPLEGGEVNPVDCEFEEPEKLEELSRGA